MEDDAVFFGDIAGFVREWAAKDADLVVALARSHLDTMRHYDPAVTFSWRLPEAAWVKKWEHVERYSARLLGLLHDMSQLGQHAHGELYSATVCSHVGWCTIEVKHIRLSYQLLY